MAEDDDMPGMEEGVVEDAPPALEEAEAEVAAAADGAWLRRPSRATELPFRHAAATHPHPSLSPPFPAARAILPPYRKRR